MVSTLDRQNAPLLIDAAVTVGTRRFIACAQQQLAERTFRRRTRDGQVHTDQRPLVTRPEPANKLSEAASAAVADACNSDEFCSLHPSQIVREADQSRTGQTVSPAKPIGQLQRQKTLRGLELGHHLGVRVSRVDQSKACCCTVHSTVNGSSIFASVTPGPCRPSRIASTISGASSVRRRTRVM